MIEVLKYALSKYGTKEIVGEIDNQQIVGWFQEFGFSWIKNDETAWCSLFMNICAKRTKHEHTGQLNARSWLNVGRKVTVPALGDVVILWRVKKKSQWGHVGLYINEIDGYINILGGNQNNKVCISPYPQYRLLGYRRLGKMS